jgi:hypothetical protein
MAGAPRSGGVALGRRLPGEVDRTVDEGRLVVASSSAGPQQGTRPSPIRRTTAWIGRGQRRMRRSSSSTPVIGPRR